MRYGTGGGRKAAKVGKVERAGKIAGLVMASGALASVVALVVRSVTFPVAGSWTTLDVAAPFVYAGASRTSLGQTCNDLGGAMRDSRLRQLRAGSQVCFAQPILNRLLLVHAVKCLGIARCARHRLDRDPLPWQAVPEPPTRCGGATPGRGIVMLRAHQEELASTKLRFDPRPQSGPSLLKGQKC